MLKIGFRVDAGNDIGTGHLMEMVSIIEALRQKIVFEPLVITTKHPFSVDKLRKIKVDKIEYLPDGIKEKDEVDIILDIFKHHNCRHLIVDLRNYSKDYYSILNDHFKTTCIILDNSEYKEIPATILVNFSITQDPEFYQNAGAYRTRYLIGPKYFLRDKEISRLRPVEVQDQVKRVFVNQGGSDPYGLTAKIIRAIERAGLNQEIIVVLGGCLSEVHQQELAEMKHSLKGNYRFYVNIGKRELYGLMQTSDLAISAAGNTLYELALLGVPSLVISHHKLHDEVASAFEKQGAAINLGMGETISEDQIAIGIGRLLNNPARRKSLNLNARELFAASQDSPLIQELSAIYSSEEVIDAG